MYFHLEFISAANVLKAQHYMANLFPNIQINANANKNNAVKIL